jgi:hypothetical protein
VKISDFERMLAAVKREHGDVEIYCGNRPIGALAIMPGPTARKIVSIILKERRYDPPKRD